MNLIGVIPARMGSSRFPGKPLALLRGMPMLGHVYFRSAMCRSLSSVVIATCDEAIAAYARRIGAPCVMTSPAHERASDRTAEAVTILERQSGQQIDCVVMIQGDEPMLTPEMIEEAVAPLLADASIQVVNLMAVVTNPDDQADPNEIKVVVAQSGDALYFSRQPMPSQTRGGAPMYKQVCIIPFRRAFLQRFNTLSATPLERAESIDMLRILEHGYRVRMVLTRQETHSVDTPSDLAFVETRLAGDGLLAQYAGMRGALGHPAGRGTA